MNDEFLEGVQVILGILIVICLFIIVHKIAAAFDFIKYWYFIVFSATAYFIIESHLKPDTDESN